MGRPKMTKDQKLGYKFWALSAPADRDDILFLHAAFLGELREEMRQRDCSAIDFALAERVAALYATIRGKELDAAKDGGLPYPDRQRADDNAALYKLLLDIKKLWTTEDKERGGEALLSKIEKAIDKSLDKMNPADAKAVRVALAQGFEDAGL